MNLGPLHLSPLLFTGAVFALVGICLVLLTILLRKKLPLRWKITIPLTGILLALVGGACVKREQQNNDEADRNLYMAICFLKDGYAKEADYYLQQLDSDEFAVHYAKALSEYMQGNTAIASLQLNTLQNTDLYDNEQNLLDDLEKVSVGDISEYQNLADDLEDEITISSEQKREVEEQFDILSEGLAEAEQEEDAGIVPTAEESDESTTDDENDKDSDSSNDENDKDSGSSHDEEDRYSDVLSDEDILRANINKNILGKDYAAALRLGVRLVSAHSQAKNRLLFAETMAEYFYNGNTLDKNYFDDTPIALFSGEEELSEDDEENKQQYLERALNSISDIYTLEADIERSRIYFAMQDYAAMNDTLKSVTNSIPARLVPDQNFQSALEVLRKALSSDSNAVLSGTECREALETVFSLADQNMIGIGTSDLTNAIADYIQYAKSSNEEQIRVTDVDTSDFPNIRVSFAGTEKTVHAIQSKEGVALRDTHTAISDYTVTDSGEASQSSTSVVCVVDESGSMSGAPMDYLKSALLAFIDQLNPNISMSIVGFDDVYRITCPLTDDHDQLINAADSLGIKGGTNITAGIQGAMEAMQNAKGSRTVLLMTDGQSDIDMNLVQEAASEGYVINTIGFGDVNTDLLTQIADLTGGEFVQTDSEEELLGIYLDFVKVIGNYVDISYTAADQNPDQQRYLSLIIDQLGVYAYQTYIPTVYDTEPYLQYMNPMAIEVGSDQNNAQQIVFDIIGTNLDQVSNVTIGQNRAVIEEGGSSEEIRVDYTADPGQGFQDVALTDADGQTRTFQNELFVGQRVSLYRFRYGNLYLYSQDTFFSSDGYLVLLNPYGYDTSEDQRDSNTLHFEMNGLLYTKVSDSTISMLQSDDQSSLDSDLQLDPTQNLEGRGVVKLDYDDVGYYDGKDNPIAEGAITISNSDDGIQITQNREGAWK